MLEANNLKKLSDFDDKSLLIFANSSVDSSFDEIIEALISPLFFEHNLKKLSVIFLTKKNLLFLINSKKKFFKFFVKSSFSEITSNTLFWV